MKSLGFIALWVVLFGCSQSNSILEKLNLRKSKSSPASSAESPLPAPIEEAAATPEGEGPVEGSPADVVETPIDGEAPAEEVVEETPLEVTPLSLEDWENECEPDEDVLDEMVIEGNGQNEAVEITDQAKLIIDGNGTTANVTITAVDPIAKVCFLSNGNADTFNLLVSANVEKIFVNMDGNNSQTVVTINEGYKLTNLYHADSDNGSAVVLEVPVVEEVQ